jgi:hypothetical protein
MKLNLKDINSIEELQLEYKDYLFCFTKNE